MTINCRTKGESDFVIAPIHGIISGTARCVNTKRSLTRSLARIEEGLAMKATQSQSADSIAERFWPQVNKDGPVPPHRPELGNCWLWTGRTQRYGRITIAGKNRFAHRVAWQIARGPISKDKPFVLHHCDNPLCVRPDHLFAGTAEDNTRDMLSKSRWAGGRSRDGDHADQAHVCVACGRKRKDKGRGLCGGCHESNRVAGTLDQYPLRRKQAAA